MDNVNSKTNIPFGVISTDELSELVDSILTHGTDMVWEAKKADFIANIEDKIVRLFHDHKDKSLVPLVEAALQSSIELDESEDDAERILEDIDVGNLCDHLIAGEKIDYNVLLKQLIKNGLWEFYESRETRHVLSYETPNGEVNLEYREDNEIVVLNSPWVVRCRHCSPCVPNAGHLDYPDGGMIAHCLPPDDLPKGYEGRPWLLGEEEPKEEEQEDGEAK